MNIIFLENPTASDESGSSSSSDQSGQSGSSGSSDSSGSSAVNVEVRVFFDAVDFSKYV